MLKTVYQIDSVLSDILNPWLKETPTEPGYYEVWGFLYYANRAPAPYHYRVNVHCLSWEKPNGALHYWVSDWDKDNPGEVKPDKIFGLWRKL